MAVISELLESVGSKKTCGIRRKGFIYTLEAIIAATLFMTIVLVVVPEFQNRSLDRGLQETVHSGLESLEKAGQLDGDAQPDEIESMMASHVPPGINYTVRLSKIETETRRFSGGQEFYFDKSGNYTELQLWIEDASDLTVTFRDENVVENRNSAGYAEGSVSGTEGYLNFTGSGTGRFDFDVYRTEGSIPDTENVRSVNYVLSGKNLTEVQVLLWQKQ